jgi:hypothetical protein
MALPSLPLRPALPLLLSMLPLLLAGACVAPGPGTAPYGAKIVFRANSPIQFRHFVLTFIGERHVSFPEYPRGFDTHDFRVASGPETLTVSWSAGTGEIAPALFTVAGQRFMLELVYSERRGRLGENEVVVTRPWPWQ